MIKRVLISLEEIFLQTLSLKYIQLLFFHKCKFFSVDRCSAAFIERAIYEDCAASYYYMMSSMEDTQRCRSVFDFTLAFVLISSCSRRIYKSSFFY